MFIRDVVNWWRYDSNYSLPTITAKSKIRGYIITGILTYGYAAASNPVINDADVDVTMFTALGAAVFWPLYWSWEFFSWFV